MLFIIEGNRAFYCFLPEFLIPGPLVYVPYTNTFVTVNSTSYLQCYKQVMCTLTIHVVHTPDFVSVVMQSKLLLLRVCFACRVSSVCASCVHTERPELHVYFKYRYPECLY